MQVGAAHHDNHACSRGHGIGGFRVRVSKACKACAITAACMPFLPALACGMWWSPAMQHAMFLHSLACVSVSPLRVTPTISPCFTPQGPEIRTGALKDGKSVQLTTGKVRVPGQGQREGR